MWLLVFICIWTAECVPINQNQEATAPAPVGVEVSLNDTVRSAEVGELSFNVSRNETTPPGSVLVDLAPPATASPETMEHGGGLITDEGDILLSENRLAVKSVWMDATVPYVIDPSLAEREDEIQAAFKMISESSCVRFVPHSTEFNYVRFQEGSGCASYVGCHGGEQPVYFSRVCSVGNLCHEILHALGLHHEHTRRDRDDHITVVWEKILKGKEKNFRIKEGSTLGLPYDLKSIMHYGEFFFSKDGTRTLLPKKSEEGIGQRREMSKLDIQKLNKLYYCDERGR